MGADPQQQDALLAQLLPLPTPPYTPLAGHETGSFAHTTITTRLPAIMDTVLADLAGLRASQGFTGDDAKQAQVSAAEQGVRRLQQEMRDGAPLPSQPLQVPPAAAAAATAAGGGRGAQLAAIVGWTNAAVSAWVRHAAGAGLQASWLGLPWLVVECYLYVRLWAILQAQPALAAADHDPFALQKLAALLKSAAAAAEVAVATEKLLEGVAEVAAADAGGDAIKQRLCEVMQYSLWGNKTDLSLLVDASQLTGASLLAGGGSQQQHLIVDEFEAVWGALAAQPGGDVHVILDNAGLELYTDLCLADFLMESGLADRVVLHGKQLPWFVSDVREADLAAVLEELGAPQSPAGVPAESWQAVQRLAGRWRQYLDDGRWVYTAHEFWTTPLPFWWMERTAPDLYANLSTSKLLIFKGDLNYRKLAYDCRWPYDTPFATALGPFSPAPLVTLRTLKADVVAGLAPGQGEQLAQLDAGWLVNGKWGVVQFAARR